MLLNGSPNATSLAALINAAIPSISTTPFSATTLNSLTAAQVPTSYSPTVYVPASDANCRLLLIMPASDPSAVMTFDSYLLALDHASISPAFSDLGPISSTVQDVWCNLQTQLGSLSDPDASGGVNQYLSTLKSASSSATGASSKLMPHTA